MSAFKSNASYYINYQNQLVGCFDSSVEARLFADFYYDERQATVSLLLNEELDDVTEIIIDHTKMRVTKKSTPNYERLKRKNMSVKDILKEVEQFCKKKNGSYSQEYQGELYRDYPAEYRRWKYS